MAELEIYRSISLPHWAKVQKVHCGLDPSFYDVPLTAVPSARRLVCVARLSPEKGHTILSEAARRLAKSGAEFELVLAGDGPLRADIETLVTQHGLQNRVRITGWLSGEQVRAELQAARALLLPSFAEGLPVVLMEAMALRRPVISTYVAGIPELVDSGRARLAGAGGRCGRLGGRDARVS